MKKWIKFSTGLATASMLAACSGGGGSDSAAPSTEPTKSLTVSGTVSAPTIMNYKPLGWDSSLGAYFVDTKVMRCTPGSGPNVAGEGTIGDDGKFSFTISGMAEGAALGCWIYINGIPSIPLAFANSTALSGSGSTQQTGYAPRANATSLSLGTISIQTVSLPGGGSYSVAVVTPSSIVDNGTTEAAAFADMTGIWSASVVDDQSNGYVHPCANEGADYQAECQAEWTNASFFINNFSATKDAEVRRGFSLWASKAAFDNCGGKEGIIIDPSWTIDGTYKDTVKTSYGAPAFDPTQLITDDMLLKAPFKKWTDSNDPSRTNCQRMGSSTQSTTCDTATNCQEFVAGFTSPDNADKLSCIINSMNSGGLRAYNWGANVCARRIDQDDWTKISGNFDGDKKCKTADCDGGIKWKSEPAFRHFSSELITSGNTGSASFTGEESDNYNGKLCEVFRTTSFYITQASATKATIIVEFSMRKKDPDNWPQECEDSSWMSSQMDKVLRHKINLTKVQ
ncbi:MAG: hypothetical protein KUL82_08620 [Bdellovibrio sp.]|nr:hypothetical protein [Bdellovibrio sp.]